MTRDELPDLEGRRLAVTTFDRNVVVVAGAGTGKTTLLVERLIYLLLGVGRGPEEIVAVTFTEKAANEMRLRLERELRAGLLVTGGGEGPDDRWAGRLEELQARFQVSTRAVRERIHAALDGLPRATIGTIHSLARQLLSLHPMEGGVSPGFEVDAGQPGPEFERLFEEGWAAWLDEELGDKPQRRRLWEKATDCFGLGDLRDLAAVLCRPSVAAALAAGRLVPGALPESIIEWVGLLRAAAQKKGGKGNLPAQCEAAVRIFDAFLAGSAPAPEPVMKTISKAAAAAETIEALNVAKGFLAADDEAVLLAIEVVRPFVDRLAERYRREGYVGFDGLIVYARDLLERHQRVRQEAKRRVRALLVDEFQDTDPVQQQLLLYLAERVDDHALSAGEVVLEPGKLFVVGDPKQSIYRFRGADVEVFRRVREQVVGQGGLHVDLLTNFRSHAGVIDVVNEGFSRLLAGGKYQAGYVAIEPKPDRGIGPPVELWGIDPALSAEEARGIEAREVARYLAESVDQELRREDGSIGRLEWRDAAILMRSMSSVHLYLEALRERDIPYVVEGEKHFYAAEEVIELVNLLGAIADPHDRIALIGVLRSPLFGLTDVEVCALAEGKALDWRAEGPTEASKRAYAMLHSLADRARAVPPPALVDAIFERTPLLDLLAEGHQGEQRTANVWKVRQLVEQASRRLGGDLVEVVRALRRSAEEGREEGESPLADETLNAVRVMSVHKAKGLEFGLVFVVNLAAKGKGRELETDAWIDEHLGVAGLAVLPSISRTGAWLRREEQIREVEENRRILYVAITRARERLVLSGMRKASEYMGLLVEAFGGAILDTEGEVAIGRARLLCRSIAQGKEVPPKPPARVKGAKAADWKSYAARWVERGEEARTCEEGLRRVTPTMLDEEEAPLEARRPGKGVEGLGKAIGQVCHAVLAGWDFRAGRRPDLSAAVDRALAGLEGLSFGTAKAAKVAKEGCEVLSAFLECSYAKKLAKADILGREVPFYLREEDGRLVSGVIDVVYRLEGALVVADWKSDDVPASAIKKATERHANQARYYREAIERAGWGKVARFDLVYLRLGDALELRPTEVRGKSATAGPDAP